ncbi:MAG TPA: acyl-CoA carboxylase subunit epsilon [Pseudonocardiaceae bacterium]
MSGDTSDRSHPHSRVIHILRGEPSDEEVAAVVVGLVSAARPEPPAPCPQSTWAGRAYRLRAPLHPRPGAWRASAWPQ